MNRLNITNNLKTGEDKERTCVPLENYRYSLHDMKTTDTVKKRKKKLTKRKNVNHDDTKTRKLMMEKKKKENTLKRLQRNVLKKMDVINDDVNAKQMLADIDIINEKIAFIRNDNKKMKNVIKTARRGSQMYDKLVEQLQDEDRLMDLDMIKNIGIVTSSDFERDIEIYIQCIYDKMMANEERSNKELSYLKQLKHKIDSLERSKKTLKNGNTYRKVEEMFYSKLPRSANNNLYANNTSSEDVSQIALDHANNDWYKQICEYGMTYLIDPDNRVKLINMVKNNDTDSASLDYKLPENVVDYATVAETLPTKEELAVNYVLRKSGYNDTDEFLRFIEHTKNDSDHLHELKCIKSTLWKSLVERNISMQEITDNLNLMTNKDIEFNKQIDHLKSTIDNQSKEISECEETKNHYLSLFNDMRFSLDKVNSILKKINISTDDKHNSNAKFTSDDEVFRTPSLKFLQDIKSVISEIDRKIMWCNQMVPDELMIDSELLNSARALYEFKSQTHAQKDFLQRKHIMEKMGSKTSVNQSVNDEFILTREDAKKQSKEFVKNFLKKDEDNSKPKRQPISFRTSSIKK